MQGKVPTTLIAKRARGAPARRRVLRAGPPPSRGTTVLGALRAAYRIEDTTLEGYRLYRGTNDSAPDFDAAPWETFTTLPHTTAALSADEQYQFVLRWRNRYGLESQNISPWRLFVDVGGGEAELPPSHPFGILVTQAAGGRARVRADYMYDVDGDLQAETWLVYLTTNGVDPDPDTDTPTEVAMNKADGVAHLDWLSATTADGTTIKVLVRVRREGPPDVDSTNTDVCSIVSATDGPAAPDTDLFHGRDLQEGQ